jgi:ferredoxin
MTPEAVIDEYACSAHGDCADVAPAVFVVEDVARVVAAAPVDVLLEAARACPSVAISVVDRDSGEQLYP